MRKSVIAIMLMLLIATGANALPEPASIPATATADEYSYYLNKNVTVLTCEQIYWQGRMIAWFPDTIQVKELCNPEMGIVTIQKCYITSIREGFDCNEFY